MTLFFSLYIFLLGADSRAADVYQDFHGCTCSATFLCKEDRRIVGTVRSPSGRIFEAPTGLREDALSLCRANLTQQVESSGRCRDYDLYAFAETFRSREVNITEERERLRQQQEQAAIRERQRLEQLRQQQEQAAVRERQRLEQLRQLEAAQRELTRSWSCDGACLYTTTAYENTDGSGQVLRTWSDSISFSAYGVGRAGAEASLSARCATWCSTYGSGRRNFRYTGCRLGSSSCR